MLPSLLHLIQSLSRYKLSKLIPKTSHIFVSIMLISSMVIIPLESICLACAIADLYPSKAWNVLLSIAYLPTPIAVLRAIFSVRSTVVSKYLPACRAGVQNHLCTYTLFAMFVPPGLFAIFRAKQSRFGPGSDGKFRTAILAVRLALGSF